MRSFNDRKEFNEHIMKHEKEKLFSCNFCLKPFLRKDLLEAHVNSVHKDVKKYNCEECDK